MNHSLEDNIPMTSEGDRDSCTLYAERVRAPKRGRRDHQISYEGAIQTLAGHWRKYVTQQEEYNNSAQRPGNLRAALWL